MNPKLVISLGNPNSVAPEVTAKALKTFPSDLLNNFIIVGDKEAINHYFSSNLLGNCQFEWIDKKKHGIDYHFNPGAATIESGLMSLKYLERAIELMKEKDIKAITTAPLSKELIAKSGREDVKDFTGHTGFIAKAYGQKRYSMMFYSDDLKVTLVTIHIPLKDVSQKVTSEKIEIAIDNSIDFCQKFYGDDYNIAVCGINPHAGENGLLGDEEKETVIPVIENYKRKGFPIEGPYPSDSLFYYGYRGKYSMIISMYHDQALAPFKMLHFMDGVNVTLGLPIIRTSPDHGTAFDIAGKNIADKSSMVNSISLALKMTEK